MTLKVGIMGKGNVGTALGNGLRRAGYEVRFGHRNPAEPVRDAARWADVVILAVPFGQIGNVIGECADLLRNKVVIDVTNNLNEDHDLDFGASTSGAEQLQKFVPRSKIVKAFNTVFAETMATGEAHGKPLTVFIATDHGDARNIVTRMARDIGFDAVSAGPLKHARYLEPLGLLNIKLGYDLEMGRDQGLQLARSGVGERELEMPPAAEAQR
jgi:hypothetical protein